VCSAAVCGNGIVEDGEVCDDGNVTSRDGCSARCDSDETCGNGVPDFSTGEECDDGNTSDADTCRTNCVVPRCGDGILDLHNGEACDGGLANSIAPDAACRPNCQPARCGDTILDGAEVCDDGNLVSGDGCSGDCLSQEVCGNNYVDAATGEECDAGAGLSRDGCSSRCTIEADSWRTPAFAMLGRIGFSMAYDASRGRIVVFGGSTFGGTILGDTWEWEGQNWRRRAPLTLPTARRDAAMAYDAVRGLTVLFGGRSNAGVLNDVWEWDGVDWRERMASASTPAPRLNHAMAWDPIGQRVLLFGGSDGSPAPPTMFDDTWTWDGTVWTHLAVPGPSARSSAGIAIDRVTDRIVLFGGDAGGGLYLADTWEWNGDTSTWASVATSVQPSARIYPMMTGTTAGVLLYGGSSSTLLADTWSWQGGAWTQVATGTPSARLEGALAYDGTHAVLFAARSGVIPAELETWRWNGSWAQVSNFQQPTPRSAHAMTTDTRRGRVLMFGGRTGIIDALADTWEFDGLWHKRSPLTSPQARWEGSLAFHDARGVAVLFGGAFFTLSPPGVHGSTHTWDGSAWSLGLPPNPPARTNAFVAYDAAHEQIVLFGGRDNVKGFDETWVWDGAWVNTLQPSPPQSTARAMAYDPIRERPLPLPWRVRGLCSISQPIHPSWRPRTGIRPSPPW
jgi:cysteine-rich repeat protein